MRRVFDDKDVDGVVVATPEHWHALATVWACQAGKDVYVEKCPSLTIWEGRKMIEAARKYKRIVQVGFENRSGPYSATARDYIQVRQAGKDPAGEGVQPASGRRPVEGGSAVGRAAGRGLGPVPGPGAGAAVYA